jgi:hypothetical protein
MLCLCSDENVKKLLLEFLINNNENNEYQMDIVNFFKNYTLFIVIAISSWPYYLEKLIFLLSSLLYGSANTFFINLDL